MYKVIKPSTSEIELFLYELDMLNGFCKLWMLSPEDGYIQNALIEAFLIHARNLVDFLTDKRNKKDDLTCSDFKDLNGTMIQKTRLEIPDKLIDKIHKHLAHLTKARIEEKPNWDLLLIRNKINQGAKIFLDQCPVSYIESSKIKDYYTKVISWFSYDMLQGKK